MRKDMAKVVTEAPRRGHANPSSKWGRLSGQQLLGCQHSHVQVVRGTLTQLRMCANVDSDGRIHDDNPTAPSAAEHRCAA